MKKLFASIALAGTLCVPSAGGLAAQDYPVRPVEVILPYAPGGGTDIAIRTVFEQVQQDLRQPFIILNRPGGGTTIGIEQTSRAKPDGYTIGVIDPAFAINETLMPSLPYDSKSLQPITMVTSTPLALAVPANRPWKTIQDLVADVKAKPGTFNFGSPGIGSGGHLAAEQFRFAIGADVVHVPYRGGGPALSELVGGQIDWLMVGPNSLFPHIEAGTIRPLALTGDKRSDRMPDVPTFAEAGLSTVDGQTYAGLLAPVGVPRDIVDTLHAAVAKALANPRVIERLDKLGLIPVGSSPDEFAKFLETDKQRWAKIIKEADVKLEP